MEGSVTGMAGFVSALAEGLTADAMWGSITPFAPIIISVFIFAFAYYVYRRVTKAGSHGKFKS